MIELQGFRFSGDLFYQEEVYLPFSKGITLLRGVNHDAGPSENNSNGTGKTRLPQILSSFIFNDCDRGTIKKMVLPSFKGHLDFRNSATKDRWSFSLDMKESAWDIQRNGQQDMESHKFTECQKFLAKEMNYTYKDWSNFTHINRHSISTLLQGKPDEKRKFLESFFNIDDFYKEKLEEYKCLRAGIEADLQVLEQDRARLGQVLEALGKLEAVPYLTNQIDFIREALSGFLNQHNALSAESIILRHNLGYWRDYYQAVQDSEGKQPFQVLKGELGVLQARLAEVGERQKAQLLVAGKAKVYDELQTLKEPTPPESRMPTAAEVKEQETLLREMREKQKLIEKFKLLKDQLPVVDSTLKVADLLEEQRGLFGEQADVKLHLSLVKDGKNCTRCGQSIDFVLKQEDPAVRHKALKEREAEIATRIKGIQDVVSKLQTWQSLTTQMEDIKRDAAKYPRYAASIDSVLLEVEALNKAFNEWQTYNALRQHYESKTHARDVLYAELKVLGYPEILSENLQGTRTKLQGEIDVVQADLDLVQRVSHLLSIVADLKAQGELQQRLLEVEEDLADLNLRTQALNERSGEFRSQLALAREMLLSKEELEARIAKGQHLMDEYVIIKAMVKFFSPAGFKMYELRQRCKLLVEKANYWSPIFFSEQYEWSLPADMDSLEFLVQPIAHRGTKPYPASDLSAGEENRAERVLLFSQLELAPKNKSLNVLFLDEIEGHLDMVGRTVFTEIVIPKLKQTFPDRCIIVISHEESLRDSPNIDHLWLAERQNRKTSLKVFENYNRLAG